MGVYDIVRIQELLVAVIDAVDFPGKQELLAQVPYVRVSGGPITFLELVVDHAAVAPSPFQRGPVPGQCWVYESNDAVGPMIAWVNEGFLCALEFAWVTDDPPTKLPLSVQVRSAEKPGSG